MQKGKQIQRTGTLTIRKYITILNFDMIGELKEL